MTTDSTSRSTVDSPAPNSAPSVSVRISIIIVNYNGATFLRECLDSILASQTRHTYEIIVVDNESQDHSLEVMTPYVVTKKIRLIMNSVNTGFSYANNQGIQAARGDYIFLLNNDTRLTPDALEKLTDYIISHPETGIVAPQLLNGDGSLQFQGSVLGHWRYKSDKPRRISFVTGAAMMMSAAFLEKIGGLDENFFFYNEDIDLCKQVLKQGLAIIYLPSAKIIHYGGLSTTGRKAASVIEGYRGGLYLCYKHYGSVIYWLYRLILFLDLIPRAVYHAVLSVKLASHRDLLKAYGVIMKIAVTNDIYLKRHSSGTVLKGDQ